MAYFMKFFDLTTFLLTFLSHEMCPEIIAVLVFLVQSLIVCYALWKISIRIKDSVFFSFPGVDAWWTKFKAYIDEEKNVSDWRSTLAEVDPFDDDGNKKRKNNTTASILQLQPTFKFLLSEFLYSRQGSKYKRNFHFDGNLTCNAPAPPIKVSVVYSCPNATRLFFKFFKRNTFGLGICSFKVHGRADMLLPK